MNEKIKKLYADEYVQNKKGIFKYVLGDCVNNTLLKIRMFDDSIKTSVYNKQTNFVKEKGTSNCPLCFISNTNNSTKIWNFNEMDADHVEAWSKGGNTDINNCQMLCKTHNRAKGNS